VHDAEAGTAISDLIAAWYPGGLGSGAPIQPTPPSGWSGHESDYHNVFAKSCRTCHVARDEGNPSNYFPSGFTGCVRNRFPEAARYAECDRHLQEFLDRFAARAPIRDEYRAANRDVRELT